MTDSAPTGAPSAPAPAATGDALLRPHAEQAHAGELAALARTDDRPRPAHWRLSPWAVVTYLLGGTLTDGTAITIWSSRASSASGVCSMT